MEGRLSALRSEPVDEKFSPRSPPGKEKRRNRHDHNRLRLLFCTSASRLTSSLLATPSLRDAPAPSPPCTAGTAGPSLRCSDPPPDDCPANCPAPPPNFFEMKTERVGGASATTAARGTIRCASATWTGDKTSPAARFRSRTRAAQLDTSKFVVTTESGCACLGVGMDAFKGGAARFRPRIFFERGGILKRESAAARACAADEGGGGGCGETKRPGSLGETVVSGSTLSLTRPSQ
jgi:hypothetical protein